MGGFWVQQNKVLNDAYINFKTNKAVRTGLDVDRAQIIPIHLKWGARGLTSVSANSDLIKDFGVDFDNAILKGVREALKAHSNIFVYNLASEGTNASAELTTTEAGGEVIHVQAAKLGELGNTIKVTLEETPDNTLKVSTFFDGALVDTQYCSPSLSDFAENGYIEIENEGSLAAAEQTVNLEGAEQTSLTLQEVSDMLIVLETENFGVISWSPSDLTGAVELVAETVKTWQERLGKRCVFATAAYSGDSQDTIITTSSGVYVPGEKGLEYIGPDNAIHWYGGAYASAGFNSLSGKVYPGAVATDNLPVATQEKYKNLGQVVFKMDYGMDGVNRVVVEADINWHTEFTKEKNRDFSKGVISRQMDFLHNSVRHVWNRYYLGKVKNNQAGRDSFKVTIAEEILDFMVAQEAIEPYSMDDIQVFPGADKDATVTRLGVTFLDAMEKLYMDVDCQ